MTREIPPRVDPSTVRHYSADGTLTVTRDHETDEHVIKSRGRNAGDRWTRRVPATRTTVEVGEKLWSIPDNWSQLYRLKPEYGPDQGIYRIPKSGDAVLLTLTHKNDRLVDAYHTVEEIGSVSWSAEASVDQDGLSDALAYVSDHADEFDDGVSDVLQYVQDNPQEVVEEAEEFAARHAPERVENYNGIPVSPFDPFRVSFRSEDGVVSHPEYRSGSEVMITVRELFGQFDVVPPSPLVSVTVR
jgi:hypothetical protein